MLSIEGLGNGPKNCPQNRCLSKGLGSLEWIKDWVVGEVAGFES